MNPLVRISAAFLAVLVVTGCSNVSVRKVPSRMDYTEDEWKAEGGGRDRSENMNGFRYYMPRPVIAVKRRFPIDLRTVIVDATMDADGVFVADLSTVQMSGPLGAAFAEVGWSKTWKKLAVSAPQLAPAVIEIAEPEHGVVFAHSGGDDAGSGGTPAAGGGGNGNGGSGNGGSGNGGSGNGGSGNGDAGGGKSGGKEPKTETTQQSEGSGGGALGGAVGGGRASISTEAASVDPKIDVSTYYDVMYEMDFEEQYVIDADSGLGEAEADVALRHGWLMGAGHMKENNEEIAKFIFGEVQKFTDILRKAVEAKLAPAALLGMDGGETGSGMGKGEVSGQGGEGPKPVTLKLLFVRFANIGRHQVLKPWEIREWQGGKGPFSINNAPRQPEWDVFQKTYPVKYGYSTEVYVELLGARPIVKVGSKAKAGDGQDDRTGGTPAPDGDGGGDGGPMAPVPNPDGGPPTGNGNDNGNGDGNGDGDGEPRRRNRR